MNLTTERLEAMARAIPPGCAWRRAQLTAMMRRWEELLDSDIRQVVLDMRAAGHADADIRGVLAFYKSKRQAWRTTTGRPDVTVSVLDSGIKWNDFSAMWDLRKKTRLSKGELEQPNAELVLEKADLPAQRRLRHVETLGGAPEVELRGHRGEATELVQFKHCGLL